MDTTDSYLPNLLSLLNLRLFGCLGLCDEDKRTEAHDRIIDAAENSLEDLYISGTDEAAGFVKRLQDLSAEQQTVLKRAEDSGLSLPFEKLCRCFELNAEEGLLLTAVLAPSLDERFRKIYRLFQDFEEPRMDFLLGLLEPDGLRRYAHAPLLGRQGRLISRGLIDSLDDGDVPTTSASRFRPAPGLLEWLCGVRTVAHYPGRAEWIEIPDGNDSVMASVMEAANAMEMAEISHEPIPLVSFFGPDSDRLLQAAESLSGKLNRALLRLNFQESDLAVQLRMLRFQLRDCALNGAAALIVGMDDRINSENVLSSAIGDLLSQWNVPTVILSPRQFVFSPTGSSFRRLILRIPVEGMTGLQRLAVWKREIIDYPLSDDITEKELRTLAGQFILTTPQIRAAVTAGLGSAITGGRDLMLADLYDGARSSSMHHLSDLARKMPRRFTLDDLVLPEQQKNAIQDLILMAKNRSQVLEEWGVGKKLASGSGVSALFTGVPGTGKTLSAQVIAGELGLDIYRVDLSTIVSKYIGETEKNLERIFTEAQNSNVVLFFDEADSLFGKRSDVGDAHDRYANIEVGYLLQRIETYDGIVLLATNLGANLDEAFARRIHFIIDFPFPDEAARLRLWQLLLPKNIRKDPDIDLAPFAASYKIAGGSIRNAVMWAIYASAQNKRPISREDLISGVEREYQKMGKVLPTFR